MCFVFMYTLLFSETIVLSVKWLWSVYTLLYVVLACFGVSEPVCSLIVFLLIVNTTTCKRNDEKAFTAV